MSSETKQTEQNTVDLLQVASFIWAKKFFAILLIAVCVFAGFFYETYYIKPKYVSTAKLVILETSDTGKISSTEVAISTYLVADYAEMVVDRTVLEEVIKQLNLNMTTEQLKGAISVKNPEDSRILEINVATTKPKLSQRITNKICTVAKKKIFTVLGVDKINIYSDASLPKEDSSLSRNMMMLMGFAVGVVLCIIIGIIVTMLDDRIKNSDDIEKYLGLCTLATIPYNTSSRSKRLLRKDRKAANN